MKAYDWAKRRLVRLFINILVLLFSVVVCFCVIDVVIIYFNLDIAAISKTAYNYEGTLPYADVEVYRHSQDVERLYELAPDSKATSYFLRRSDDIDSSEVVFSTNRFGFRSNGGEQRTKQKAPGVFRIIALGGSNTFGFSISDQQTWPAQLEKVLNEKMPGRFEVWNAGLSSYNMAQKIAYAKQIVDEYEPDLLLLQHFNTGRRAFFHHADYSYFFRRNKKLWCENIPLIWFDMDGDTVLHKFFVRHWALYRVVVASYNHFLISSACKDRLSDDFSDMNLLLTKYFDLCFSLLSDKLAVGEFHDFIAKVKEAGGPGFAMIDNSHKNLEHNFIADVPLLYIHHAARAESRPEEYFDIHPPSQVYEWYGEKIADWLIKEGLIPSE